MHDSVHTITTSVVLFVFLILELTVYACMLTAHNESFSCHIYYTCMYVYIIGSALFKDIGIYRGT